ncbi:MAG: hypothetical protein BMS9Abin23_0014 [Thermodesulfobacteriota bacterium]|nr:MAG: hypothetical protein BMS9Abin23_0014 [Thermodesulfobacteriota bacterium]
MDTFSLSLFDTLFNTITLLGNWGYLILFMAAFLESSAFVGLIIPGETTVVLAGFLASQGYLDLGDSIWVIALGAVLGDSVGYSFGKAIGGGYFKKHKRLFFIKEKHIDRATAYFHLHGGKTIFFGRFIGFFRAMAPFAAGMLKMDYPRFLFYNVTGGVLWTVSFTLLGYFFGESWHVIERWSGRTGVFILFIIVVSAAFYYVYRKAARRQTEIISWLRQTGEGFLQRPLVKGFVERHPAIISFIMERLSPRGYLGLHLTVGIILSGVFVWVFGGITEDVLTGDPLVLVDRWVLDRVLYFSTPFVTSVMMVITGLGGNAMILAVSLVAVFVLIVKRRGVDIFGYLSAVAGGGVLVFIMKAAFRRPRPLAGTPVIEPWGWGFPGPHAMMSVVMYGMITYLVIRDLRSWRLRIFISTASAFLVFLIGMSRIYLQEQYLSDILAGFAGGLFWLTVCVTGLEVYKKKAASS